MFPVFTTAVEHDHSLSPTSSCCDKIVRLYGIREATSHGVVYLERGTAFGFAALLTMCQRRERRVRDVVVSCYLPRYGGAETGEGSLDCSPDHTSPCMMFVARSCGMSRLSVADDEDTGTTGLVVE